MKCQNGRFARIENAWTGKRPVQCDREATHHASGPCAQDVDVCPLHAAALSRYDWTLSTLRRIAEDE